MIRPVFSTDPMQPNQTRLAPVYSSGPMQPRADVPSFDLTRRGPSRSLVTGDRSLTRNPNGRMGMPMLDAAGERIGSRGMTPQRMSEMAGRRLASAMRGGNMNAAAMLYRGGFGGFGGFGGRGFGPMPAMRGAMPQPGYGAPQPPPTSANNSQPLPPALDPLANLPPPATTEEALGMLGYGAPGEGSNSQAQQPLMPQRMPWAGQPLPGGMPMGQLPTSTMMGGAGTPPPPDLEFRQLPGNPGYGVPVVRGEVQKQFLPMPSQTPRTFQMRQDATGAFRQFYGDEMLPGPTYSGQVVPGSYVRRATQGQPAPMQYTPDLPQATEKITEGPTGTTRTYTQPRGTQAAPPAGEGGSNYYDSLLPAAPTASTQTGQMPAVPTASTQTGQMPNVAYAAPLSPEQLLEQARNEYARTGTDAALKQYFAQYPSEAVRLNQQEQQIWQQVAGQVDRLGRAASNRGDAQDARNAYIDRFAGPFTQGAISAEFEQNYPGAMRAINGSLPMPDLNLIGSANDLSRRAAAAAGRTMPAMAPRVPLQPMPPPLPMMIAERNPEGIVARLNQLPILPAFMRPTVRR